MAVLTYPCPFAEKSQDPNYQCKLKSIEAIPKLLRRHIMREHIKHLHCDRCSKRFGNEYERKRHIRMESACKNVKPEAPVPKYVSVLAILFKAYKFPNWDGLLFENGRPIYDYQDPGNIDSISIFSSPATELTSSEDHPNEPHLSTIASSEEYDPSRPLENDPEGPSDDDYDDDDDGCNEAGYDKKLDTGATNVCESDPTTSATEMRDFRDFDPSLGEHSNSDRGGATFSDFGHSPEFRLGESAFDGGQETWNYFDDIPGLPINPTAGEPSPEDNVTVPASISVVPQYMYIVPQYMYMGQYDVRAEQSLAFSDFGHSPEFRLGESAFNNGQETWNDFDDIPGLPINPTAGEPSPEDNVTGPASVVPQYM